MKVKLNKEESQRQEQGYLIKELVNSKGWLEVLKPWLEDRIHNSWVDPRSFESDEKYLYAMKTAWAFAQASEQILAFTTNMIEEAEALTKKEKGEAKDKLRESTI